jgi:DNA-binding GntR family transcriptional regulator
MPAGGTSNSELAYQELKARIVSGALAPGARLVEAQLAAQIKVSRTPIRDALRRLVSEGLASRDESGGLIVHAASQRQIEEIYLVREVLDGLAARLAAERITDRDLVRLRLTLDALRGAAEAGRTDEVIATNLTFHQLIYEAAGNSRLEKLGLELREFVRLFSREAFASRDRAVAIVGEHVAIVDALEARDPEAAEHAAREHLRRAVTHLAKVTLARELAAT